MDNGETDPPSLLLFNNTGCPRDYQGKNFDNIWQLRFVYNFQMHNDVDLRYRHGHRPKEWQVFGSVQPENFDPLAFSKMSGDYPHHGRLGESHWLAEADVLVEETVTRDGDNWDQVKPSFVV